MTGISSVAAGNGRTPIDQREIDRILRRQAGVISRRQVLAAGGTDTYVARRLRRREWKACFEGVYVEHTGPLTRTQREWAAVLVHDPCVLAGRSALRAHGLDVADTRPWGRSQVVEVAVDQTRRVSDPPGVRSIQLRHLDRAALFDASPPRLRLEHTALLVASREAREDATVAVLADAVRGGGTTSARLMATLDLYPRLRRRGLMREALTDVGTGVRSALEWRYLRDVERAHGLPVGTRQARESLQVVEHEVISVVLRDVRYPRQAALVELDGRLGHAATLDRWADLDRDLLAAAHGSVTLRAGWQQVLEPCRLAVLVGSVLTARGWDGRPQPCRRPDCESDLDVTR